MNLDIKEGVDQVLMKAGLKFYTKPRDLYPRQRLYKLYLFLSERHAKFVAVLDTSTPHVIANGRRDIMKCV